MTDDTAQSWRVCGSVKPYSVLFEGTEYDARTYVENNFPRVHVQPGSIGDPQPDVYLVSPSGNPNTETGVATFDGGAWSDDDKPAAQKAPAKKAPAKKTQSSKKAG